MKNLLTKIIDAYPELKHALLDAQTFDPHHLGFQDIYYKIMETDETRVGAFRQAFQFYGNFRDKVVCEVGVGTLVLSKYFLPHVRKAYLIESNPNLFDFIETTLKKEGWHEKVVFVKGNALEVALPEQVDYLVGENMSVFCANELQVQIFQHLRQFLRPGGKLIPEKIINLVQLGNTRIAKQPKHFPLMFTRHWPTLMTLQRPVNTIDLYQAKDGQVETTIEVTPLLDGVLNCALLNSWIQCAPGVNFTGTDSLMPPTVIQLKDAVKVKAGNSRQLSIKFSYGTSLDDAVFEVESQE